jgi:hypothetical protein
MKIYISKGRIVVQFSTFSLGAGRGCSVKITLGVGQESAFIHSTFVTELMSRISSGVYGVDTCNFTLMSSETCPYRVRLREA